jgi:uncharacterized protein (DUF1810 family)
MPDLNDPYRLHRFVDAQADHYPQALSELRAGRKQTHWMWFIFPQFAGLGQSEISKFYALSSLPEARAYLAHALLGARLLECCRAVLATEGRTALEIFGTPDDLKLRSSATLFAEVTAPDSPFFQLLTKYFAGQRDERTLALIRATGHPG